MAVRVGHRVGLKGAGGYANPGDVRTAGANAVSDEDRNEPRESSGTV